MFICLHVVLLLSMFIFLDDSSFTNVVKSAHLEHDAYGPLVYIIVVLCLVGGGVVVLLLH